MYLTVFKHGFLRSPFTGEDVLMEECKELFLAGQRCSEIKKKKIYVYFIFYVV